MASRSPTMPEVLNRVAERVAAEMFVARPARVESYDSATQTANVKPLVKELFETETGDFESVSLPIVNQVPVVFPGAGGLRITFPVRAGDTGLLIFADRSIDAWLDQGGETAPADRRRHNLSDAVFVPGLHPNNAAWTGHEAGVITIGDGNAASEFVATANRVLTELQKLKTAYDGHTHTISGTTAAAGAPIVASNSAGPTSAALVAPASAKVKIRG